MSTTQPANDALPPSTPPPSTPACCRRVARDRPSHVAARWAHLGMILTGLAGLLFVVPFFLLWVVPLIVRSTTKDVFTRQSSTAALNFGLTQSIVGGVSSLVGLALLAVPYAGVPVFDAVLTTQILWGVAAAVLSVVGTTQANNGEPYRYPALFAWPMVRMPQTIRSASV